MPLAVRFAGYSCTLLFASATFAFGQSAGRTASPFGKVPLSFEVNRGQAVSSARFVSQGTSYRLLLEDDGAAFETPGGAVAAGLRLRGANRHAPIQGMDELSGKANYLPAGDPRS